MPRYVLAVDREGGSVGAYGVARLGSGAFRTGAGELRRGGFVLPRPVRLISRAARPEPILRRFRSVAKNSVPACHNPSACRRLFSAAGTAKRETDGKEPRTGPDGAAVRDLAGG